MRSRYLLATITLFIICMLTAAPLLAGSHFHKHDKGIEGSGDMETRELDVDRFDSIKISGAFDLEITIGSPQKVIATIDDNLWDNFDSGVSSGTLYLDWDKSCSPDRDCRIEIVVPELRRVALHGAGDVEISEYEGDSFEFDLRGAGDLTMEGQVDQLEINISGAGDVDTRKLRARSADVTISGVGDADISVEEELDARVSGVGDLRYYGDPEQRKTRVSGLGSIKQK